jgi:hypothetical protein
VGGAYEVDQRGSLEVHVESLATKEHSEERGEVWFILGRQLDGVHKKWIGLWGSTDTRGSMVTRLT